MSTTKNQDLPLFFNYKEEDTDNGYETIQDFYLSWLLRCSSEKFRNSNQKIFQYSRKAVFAFIYGENDFHNERKFIIDKEISEDFKVINVKTRRQYKKKIDLYAEIEIEENQICKKYIFNIENKWYTKIKEYQLEENLKAINDKYINNVVLINLVIFCDEEMLKKHIYLKNKCLENNYKVLTIMDIRNLAEIFDETDNSLFDEYWFCFHRP